MKIEKLLVLLATCFIRQFFEKLKRQLRQFTLTCPHSPIQARKLAMKLK
jgi:hypothetical protein